MRSLTPIVALGLAWMSGPAPAANLTTQTQPFNVTYQQHGSTGAQEIAQYSGPLKIYDVTVNWSAGNFSGYEITGDDTGQPHFNQPYSGTAGFRMFDPDANLVGQAQGAFSGVSDCTPVFCLIGGMESGSTHLDPLDFMGSRSMLIDFWGSITPNFNYYGEDSIGSSGVQGSVVYLLGPVPEPASWAMMVAGFGAIGGAIRSRRRVKVSFGLS